MPCTAVPVSWWRTHLTPLSLATPCICHSGHGCALEFAGHDASDAFTVPDLDDSGCFGCRRSCYSCIHRR
eukprot:6183713-Pleurochrysis_carterae.AAC.3